ncbi:MAG: cytochrome c oxidase subunit 2 [Actinomycetia bacterium]|nr:cytochrome c oxidase subunit 2 [Actinomycetes bacterium]
MLMPVVALATAGVAAAANGGFTPPTPHSPNTRHINSAYYLIFGFTAAIFLIVQTVLIVFIWKYRSRGRPREVEGAQVHGHTRLELIWTALPAILLCIIGIFVFWQLPKIADVPAANASDRLNVKVVGHQYYWEFQYPNGARSIGDLHVPAGKVVYLTITSPDVPHSWWIPQLEGKTDAIPGKTNHNWFKADRVGTYLGQCAEFCGVYHEAMSARVIATSEADYQSWLAGAATTDLGRAEFQGVCATCHGMKGQGGYGPALDTNPIVIQPGGLEAIVRNGFGRMPPVANDWTKQQIDALLAYLKQNVYKGAAPSGG